MGPPADIEYAVDPVGVDIITPSPLYVHIYSLSEENLTLNTFEVIPPLDITISFSA